MVRDYEAAKHGGNADAVDEQVVGRLTGLLAGIFSFSGFLTAYAWGCASNFIGRKPVIVIGTAVSYVSMLWFGLAGSYGNAMAARAFGGFFNGILGAWKCMIGESTAVELQGKFFGYMSLAWGLGCIAGPALGGAFARPCDGRLRLPLCGPGQLLRARPYFLACLVGSTTLLASLLLCAILLRETLPQPLRERGLLAAKLAAWRAARRAGKRRRGEESQPLRAPGEGGGADGAGTEGGEEAAGERMPGSCSGRNVAECRPGEQEAAALLAPEAERSDQPLCRCSNASLHAGDTMGNACCPAGKPPPRSDGDLPRSPSSLDRMRGLWRLTSRTFVGGISPFARSESRMLRQGSGARSPHRERTASNAGVHGGLDGGDFRASAGDVEDPWVGSAGRQGGVELSSAAHASDRSQAELTSELGRGSKGDSDSGCGCASCCTSSGSCSSGRSCGSSVRDGISTCHMRTKGVDCDSGTMTSTHVERRQDQASGLELATPLPGPFPIGISTTPCSTCSTHLIRPPDSDDDRISGGYGAAQPPTEDSPLLGCRGGGAAGSTAATAHVAASTYEQRPTGQRTAACEGGAVGTPGHCSGCGEATALLAVVVDDGKDADCSSSEVRDRDKGGGSESASTGREAAAASGGTDGRGPVQDLQPEKQPLLPWYRYPQVVLTILGYGITALIFCALDEVFPIFAAAPRDAGGLGMREEQIAPPLMFFGAVLMPYSLYGYPPLQRTLGTLRMTRAGLLVAVGACLMIPLVANLRSASYAGAMVLLYSAMVVKAFAQCSAFTGSIIAVNAAPAPEQLGAVNGVGQTLAALVRGLGPATGGLLWAASVGIHAAGQQFLTFAMIALLALGNYVLYRFVRLPGMK